jgi:8-oxo-dGTP pyrophosphatase MutT (NUDIX family)
VTAVINEGFVGDAIGTLQSRYRPVEVEQTTIDVPASDFDEYVENARDGYVGGAYAWVMRRQEEAGYPSESYDGGVVDGEQALLILPRGRTEWGLPGGGVENDETYERAVRREVLEETGVGCEVTGLWHLHRRRWQSEDPADDRETDTLYPFFDADYVGGSISVQAGEVDGAAWFAEPPSPLMDATERRANTFF